MDWGDLERGRPSHDRGGDSYFRGIPYASIVACAVREPKTVEIWAAEEHRLDPLRTAFAYGSASEATRAAEQIKDRVRDVAREQNRPRRLLLVVNPVAGDGRWVSSSTDVRQRALTLSLALRASLVRQEPPARRHIPTAALRKAGRGAAHGHRNERGIPGRRSSRATPAGRIRRRARGRRRRRIRVSVSGRPGCPSVVPRRPASGPYCGGQHGRRRVDHRLAESVCEQRLCGSGETDEDGLPGGVGRGRGGRRDDKARGMHLHRRVHGRYHRHVRVEPVQALWSLSKRRRWVPGALEEQGACV